MLASSTHLTPPIEPMLAQPLSNPTLDSLHDVAFEPKWDGFRCLLFRMNSSVILQGRGRSRIAGEAYVDLAYAFPEIVTAALTQLPEGVVLDGEIVVIRGSRLDFAALSTRLRPRSEEGGPSIMKLSTEAPASLLAFDLLAEPDPLVSRPFKERRAALASLSRTWSAPLLLTPSTTDPAVATVWFTQYESSGIDGIIVKPLGEAYTPGKRSQGKVKHARTLDAIVAGWRPQVAKDGLTVVGSLLLGLHDSDGRLHYVGGTSAFTASMRTDLVHLLAPHAVPVGQAHPWVGAQTVRVPGGASRWSKGKDWRPVTPFLVVEVTYDQMEADRFRHSSGFVRWRPDRDASSCTFEQVPLVEPSSVEDLLRTRNVDLGS